MRHGALRPAQGRVGDLFALGGLINQPGKYQVCVLYHYSLGWHRPDNLGVPLVLPELDTLGFEPRAFRMRSGCDATTPCALGR